MRHSKKFAALAIAAGVAITASAAFAYWTTSGAGTGSASTGTSSAVSVTQLGTASDLVPGGPAAAVNFRISNPASFNQYIASVSVSKVSVTGPNVDPSHPCTVNDFELVQPNAIDADLTPGHHDYVPSGATIALKNLPSNQDGCKGATLNLAFAAS